MLSDDTKRLDSAVNDVLKYIYKMAAANPETVRIILQECIHKMDMVQKIQGKLESVVVK